MNKYKYTVYDYSKVVNPKIKLCYPKDYLIQSAELRNDTLYVTFRNSIDTVTVNFNINELIEVNHG